MNRLTYPILTALLFVAGCASFPALTPDESKALHDAGVSFNDGAIPSVRESIVAARDKYKPGDPKRAPLDRALAKFDKEIGDAKTVEDATTSALLGLPYGIGGFLVAGYYFGKKLYLSRKQIKQVVTGIETSGAANDPDVAAHLDAAQDEDTKASVAAIRAGIPTVKWVPAEVPAVVEK